MKPYPFDAVLFDMDGTIINNVPLHQQVWKEFTRLHGLNLSDEELSYAKGRKALEVVAHFFGEDLGHDEIARLTEERQILYRERLATANTEAVSQIAGVEAYLIGLGNLGVPRVLATDAPLANVEAVFRKFNFTPYFDALITSDRIQHGKPHPEIFLTAARQAGANPHRCLVAEDSAAGIAAAKAAGCACLALATTQSKADLQRQAADFIAADFYNLPAAIAIPIGSMV
ncbi:HAD-IA family hydrolase [Pannus brasiliensis CCIBt3594]|uniref:HAD-IA family hydrolase n=1 Tax=Pannus brasiliensis CCIBt3594 TaxID=1427578 RepID=A0AAW9QZQ9_9CHRO